MYSSVQILNKILIHLPSVWFLFSCSCIKSWSVTILSSLTPKHLVGLAWSSLCGPLILSLDHNQTPRPSEKRSVHNWSWHSWARTPAASHWAPSAISSHLNKCSNATSALSAMADAAAMMTMMDTINHAMDCMLSFQSLLMMSQSMTSAQALPETPPQVLSLTSPQSFQSLATTHLNHDVNFL